MTQSIVLERRMTLDAAARLWDEICARPAGPVTLDASEVRHLSAAALQVLLVAERLCRRDGRAFTLDAPSPAFAEGLRLLGGALPDPGVPA